MINDFSTEIRWLAFHALVAAGCIWLMIFAAALNCTWIAASSAVFALVQIQCIDLRHRRILLLYTKPAIQTWR